MTLTRQTSERIVAISVAIIAVVLAAFGVWVFHSPAGRTRSLTDTIFSDRITLGLVRLLVAVVALYALTSIAVLITRGQWLRSISTTGIEAESARETDAAFKQLEERYQRAVDELARTKRLFRRSSDG